MAVSASSGSREAADADRARLYGILRRFRVGTLVTRSDGSVHTQPLAVASIDEGEEEIVFVTMGDSDAARDVSRRPETTVVFQDGRHCASWTGTAQITDDPSRVLRLWREHMRIWFPTGPRDERLVLLAVRGDTGEYWDVSRARRTLTTLRRLGRVVERAPEASDPPTHEQHAYVRIHEDEEAPR
jgi:general stress protein 26